MPNFRFSLNNKTKTAQIKLSPDSEQWTDEIYEYILQRHPYLSDYLQGDVDWSTSPINEESGDGQGTIIARIGDKPPIRIPVIVEDFTLKPVDLYKTPDGSYDVLDQDVLLTSFSPETVQLGRKVDPYQDYSTNNNPGLFFNFMNKLSSYQNYASDQKRVLQYVSDDYPLLSESCNRIKEAASAGSRKYDSRVIEKRGGRYHVSAFQSGHKVDEASIDPKVAFKNPQSTLASASRRADKSKNCVLVEKDLNRDVYVTNKTASQTIVDTTYKNLSPGEKVTVLNDKNEKVPGVVVSLHRMNYQYDKPISLGFISGDGEYMEKVRGVLPSKPSKGLDDDQITTIEKAPNGAKGFLHVGDGGVIGPMKIMNAIVNFNEEFVVKVESRYDGIVRLLLSDKINKIIRVERRTGNQEKGYSVPRETPFILADKEVVPSSYSPAEIIAEKTASNNLGMVEISKEKDGFLCKSGERTYKLSPGETKGLLFSLGAKKDGVSNIIKEASKDARRKLCVYGVENPRLDHKGERPLSSRQEKIARHIINVWLSDKEKINKLASSMQAMRQPPQNPMMPQQMARPPQNVPPQALQDHLVSMNMMNQHNTMRFAEAEKEIEEAKKAVAQILMGIRKGDHEELDEEEAKEALFAIQKLTKNLKRLNAYEE